MMIIVLDQQLFLFFNQLPHNFILDNFFSLLSFLGSFGAIWFLIAAFSILTHEKKDWHCIIPVTLSIIFSYLLVEIFLKPFFGRLRPEFVLEEAKVIYKGLSGQSLYSFPSGHTTVSFAAAFVLSKTIHQEKLWPFFLAFLIGFSRIYLGLHFPLDVFVGGLLGLLIGWFSLFFYKKISSKEL